MARSMTGVPVGPGRRTGFQIAVGWFGVLSGGWDLLTALRMDFGHAL